MLLEACTRHPHGFREVAQAAIFLGELREGNRRRVTFDPTSQVLYAWVVHHAEILPAYGAGETVMERVRVAVRPALSVIVSVTL